jgi:hypothetical protein
MRKGLTGSKTMVPGRLPPGDPIYVKVIDCSLQCNFVAY